MVWRCGLVFADRGDVENWDRVRLIEDRAGGVLAAKSGWILELQQVFAIDLGQYGVGGFSANAVGQQRGILPFASAIGLAAVADDGSQEASRCNRTRPAQDDLVIGNLFNRYTLRIFRQLLSRTSWVGCRCKRRNSETSFQCRRTLFKSESIRNH